jgi:hypothetical protein
MWAKLNPVIPSWFWNSDYITRVAQISTWSIDWSVVGPNVAWNIGFFGTLLLTFFFFLLLFRRLWVDTEDLLFPMENIAGELMLMTQSEPKAGEGSAKVGKAKLFSSKYFWIALAIMLHACMQHHLFNRISHSQDISFF